MPTQYDLTTLAKAAGRLKVSTTDTDLPALITAASRTLARFVGYELHRREGLTESVAGHGGLYLFLRAGAVQSVERVQVQGADADPSTYVLESPAMGRIAARGRFWPFTGRTAGGITNAPLQAEATGDIVVTYTAGWVTPGQVQLALAADPSSTLASDLPEDVEEAALFTLAAWHSRLGKDLDVASVSIGGASESYSSTGPLAVPAMAAMLLGPHKKLTRSGS